MGISNDAHLIYGIPVKVVEKSKHSLTCDISILSDEQMVMSLNDLVGNYKSKKCGGFDVFCFSDYFDGNYESKQLYVGVEIPWQFTFKEQMKLISETDFDGIKDAISAYRYDIQERYNYLDVEFSKELEEQIDALILNKEENTQDVTILSNCGLQPLEDGPKLHAVVNIY